MGCVPSSTNLASAPRLRSNAGAAVVPRAQPAALGQGAGGIVGHDTNITVVAAARQLPHSSDPSSVIGQDSMSLPSSGSGSKSRPVPSDSHAGSSGSRKGLELNEEIAIAAAEAAASSSCMQTQYSSGSYQGIPLNATATIFNPLGAPNFVELATPPVHALSVDYDEDLPLDGFGFPIGVAHPGLGAVGAAAVAGWSYSTVSQPSPVPQPPHSNEAPGATLNADPYGGSGGTGLGGEGGLSSDIVSSQGALPHYRARNFQAQLNEPSPTRVGGARLLGAKGMPLPSLGSTGSFGRLGSAPPPTSPSSSTGAHHPPSLIINPGQVMNRGLPLGEVVGPRTPRRGTSPLVVPQSQQRIAGWEDSGRPGSDSSNLLPEMEPQLPHVLSFWTLGSSWDIVEREEVRELEAAAALMQQLRKVPPTNFCEPKPTSLAHPPHPPRAVTQDQDQGKGEESPHYPHPHHFHHRHGNIGPLDTSPRAIEPRRISEAEDEQQPLNERSFLESEDENWKVFQLAPRPAETVPGQKLAGPVATRISMKCDDHRLPPPLLSTSMSMEADDSSDDRSGSAAPAAVVQSNNDPRGARTVAHSSRAQLGGQQVVPSLPNQLATIAAQENDPSPLLGVFDGGLSGFVSQPLGQQSGDDEAELAGARYSYSSPEDELLYSELEAKRPPSTAGWRCQEPINPLFWERLLPARITEQRLQQLRTVVEVSAPRGDGPLSAPAPVETPHDLRLRRAIRSWMRELPSPSPQ